MAGEQYSTINKDTRNLVKAAVQMATDLSKGKTPEVNDTKSYENGVKAVPAFLLPPQIATKENAAESYANDAACAGPHGSITRGSWGRPGTLTPKSLDVE